MIDTQGASAYFTSTTFSQVWSEFSTKQRQAAIDMAKREFSRALGRALNENEAAYKYGDTVREEYACYEQALYTLLRDAQPNASGTAIPSLDQDDQKSPAYTMAWGKGQWAPRALAWLGNLSVVCRNG